MRLPGGNSEPEKPEEIPASSSKKPVGPLIFGLAAAFAVVYLLISNPGKSSQQTGDSASNPAEASNQTSGDKTNQLPGKSMVGSRNSPLDQLDNLKMSREMATQVCGSCHLFPEPDIADRFTWSNEILPRMNDWLGYGTVAWTNEPGGDQVIASGKVPKEPIISFPDYKLIHTYFLGTAPLKPKPQVNKPQLDIGLKHFRVRESNYRIGRPMTTLVKIDEQEHLIFIGDSEKKKLAVIAPDGKVAASLDMPNPIVHLLRRPDGYYASMIGSVFPSDKAEGMLVKIKGPNSKSENSEAMQTLLTGLRRPVESMTADFNGDGREDLVVATYGNILGNFSWYEQKPDGSYEEHILLERPGALGVAVHDFDGDGRPDIVVAMAQAREGISLFLNRGNGQFEQKIITEQHPSWGTSHLEMVDFNKDGLPDLLVTNGDNGDSAMFANCVKPYHGIRLYLNDGKGKFHEAWFYPMYGAYRAIARDFDLDGDLDIAAVSFFPNYLGAFKESFVYLENQGTMKFKASTFVESIAGRWITMDVGDMDGDGDPDIVLGAFNRSFGDIPELLGNNWEERGPSIMILENTIRQPSGK